MLITNSDYQYTQRMMSYAYDEFLPDGKTWRDLFDMVATRCCCCCGCCCCAATQWSAWIGT